MSSDDDTKPKEEAAQNDKRSTLELTPDPVIPNVKALQPHAAQIATSTSEKNSRAHKDDRRARHSAEAFDHETETHADEHLAGSNPPLCDDDISSTTLSSGLTEALELMRELYEVRDGLFSVPPSERIKSLMDKQRRVLDALSALPDCVRTRDRALYCYIR
jgi:hypothetical protein